MVVFDKRDVIWFKSLRASHSTVSHNWVYMYKKYYTNTDTVFMDMLY